MVEQHSTELKRRYTFTLKEMRKVLTPHVHIKLMDVFRMSYPQQSPTQAKDSKIEFRFSIFDELNNSINEMTLNIDTVELGRCFGLTGTPFEFGLWSGRSPNDEKRGVPEENDIFYIDTIEGNLDFKNLTEEDMLFIERQGLQLCEFPFDGDCAVGDYCIAPKGGRAWFEGDLPEHPNDGSYYCDVHALKRAKELAGGDE